MANVRIPPAHQPAPSRRRRNKRLNLERLEPRLLLAADTSASAGILTHGGICSCPICSGVGLEQFQPEPAQVVSGGGTTSAASIAGLPQLSSRPGAAATIFLDFDGNTEALWGSYTNVVTRVFDRDGDETSFSASEISAIQEIWARVAEDFAPFNINVTTVEPPSFANKVAIRVAIGGNYSDWFCPAAGGVAYVGAFYNSSSNVAYVFEDALGNGNPKYVAEAASHEAGHTFGLYHQAVWNGNQLVEEYNSGDSNWAPIMGVGYYSTRTTWNSGPTSNSPSQIQDDLAVLANSSNGFGYVADDYGGTTATATDLVTSGGNVNTTGLIGNNSDWDLFKFTTDGGALNLSLNVAQFGANLDSALDLLNAAGQTILSSSPSASLGSSLATTLAAGTYYVAVHSSGGYGNLGTYTLSGSVPGGGGGSQTQNPEIEVTVGSVSIADGATVNYGTRTVGTAITRMFVVRNAGTGTLNLTPLNANSIPAGFTLVANLGATSLAPGESTSFKIQMTSTAAGTYSGVISLGNNDSDESPFEITIRGVVEAPEPQAVVRYIDNGASGFSTSGTWYRVTGTGRESDIHRALPGSGTTVATWTFSGLDAGQYRVSATWPGASYYASNAPFSIYNGSQALKTVSINQKAASSGFSDAGSQWADLGTVTITGNTLVVRLTNAANNWVVADAIRIESVGSSGTTGGGGGQVEPA
ncbi:MAG TPA: choice-of-anchor D domain-containing protein, partial [Pirellulaceae bacterium]|nr:choice-of-anchor D domain-containing protein [Pirellulaceae bacterium]